MLTCPSCKQQYPRGVPRCPHCDALVLHEWERPTTERITLDLSEYRELCRVEDPDEAKRLISALESAQIRVRLVAFDPRTAQTVQRIMVLDKHRQRAKELLDSLRLGPANP